MQNQRHVAAEVADGVEAGEESGRIRRVERVTFLDGGRVGAHEARLPAGFGREALIKHPDQLGQFGGGQFSTFKQALADLAVAKLGPIGREMQRFAADPAYIDGVLADGADRARAIARPVWRDVRRIVGFLG